MKLTSIRLRLTSWYLAVLMGGLAIFGVASWYGMRTIALDTVDDELQDRIRDTEKLLQQQDQSPSEIRAGFRDRLSLAPAADLLQVKDEQGNWWYRSPALEREGVQIRPLPAVSLRPAFEILNIQGEPVRFATARVVAKNHTWMVQAAESIHELTQTLDRFALLLRWLIPGLLILAGAGGYWISGRALSPVDRITAAAESISIHNLGAQLSVPGTGDELQRLSETLNRMLSRLSESVRRISQFTADASHELRGPVSIIRTTAELALQSERSRTESREDMTGILTEAERVSKLIDGLLLLARADADADGLQHELLDLSTVVRQAVESSRLAAEQKRIQLHSIIGDQPVVAIGDSDATRRLFFILIDNAVKYTPESGEIDVRLEARGASTTVSVTDTGIGIADEDLPYIFDRFWRADKVRSRGMGGAGLGLSIAKWIADRHHWTIHAGSTPGGGSRFTVTVPQVDVESAIVSDDQS